ncbi:MAG TPA: hypothetical protein PLL57_09520 [Flavobacteriales bacterium]|nr:hypothetical protein [Flavobacteriales bacterium]
MFDVQEDLSNGHAAAVFGRFRVIKPGDPAPHTTDREVDGLFGLHHHSCFGPKVIGKVMRAYQLTEAAVEWLPGMVLVILDFDPFHMKMRPILARAFAAAIILISCQKDDDNPTPPGGGSGVSEPRLILKFTFDSTQVRLNATGQPADVPAGHGAQHPRFNAMTAHYVEFAPTAWTLPGQGALVYHAPETTAGGANAIDFSQAVLTGEGEAFLDIPLSQLPAGTYPYLRVSIGYQNFEIDFRYTDTQFGTGVHDLHGTIASFIGFNTFISTFNIDQQTLEVNDDKPQGFWAFEVNDPPFPFAPITGQAPPGATTVPNPLFDSSPIPAGSCLVTGVFAEPLVVTGNETQNVVIKVSISTNNSFEWIDNGDGIFEPGPPANDQVVDMGTRGMIPTVQ